jgi:hypothetical protein
MEKYSLVFIFLLFNILSFGQIPGPTTNWYFGNNAGVTFNSGSPVALTNGVLITTEGVATISDNSGNLLFYTDGLTVYHRLHGVMTNGTGLFGDASSTQSAIIVQKPDNPNIYYIFTSDNDAGPNGICYSTVDMSIGLGQVTSKNVQLKTPSCEKLCAVRHCNNQDVWVISHDWNNNTFTAWLVNSSGVGTSTSWSNAGAVINGTTQSAYGQLKASPNGRKLAACHYGTTTGGMNIIELYDFNPVTGFVTNGVTLHNQLGLYGVEFSPDGKVLYAGTNQGLLLQWNLCAGTLSQIQASRTQISNAGPFIGSIQRGPDGKIYVARNNTSLSVINNPNVVGLGCNYSDLSIPLAGRSSRMGLPNFASFYVQPQFILQDPIINCNNVTFSSPVQQYSDCITQNIQYTYLWNFGDGQTSFEQNPTHEYLSVGVYNVSLTITGPCTSIILNKVVNVQPGGITVSVYTN